MLAGSSRFSRGSIATPREFDADWDLVLDGNTEERRRVDFEIGKRVGNCPRDVDFVSFLRDLERHLPVRHRLPSKLNLEVRVSRARG